MTNPSSPVSHRPVIALLTDFGLKDSFVGVLKGVMLGIAPDAQLVDITHAIAPQNVASGAWTLAISYRYFPVGTVFACVVDPGVGSSRQAIALHAGDWYFVGPDNGLFSSIVREQPVHGVVTLSNPAYQLANVSTTFHGRDIFAPAAAHLAMGLALSELGPHLDPASLQTLPGNDATRSASTVQGRVAHIDTYGNIITNIPSTLVPDIFSRPYAQLTFTQQQVNVTQRRHFFSEQPTGNEGAGGVDAPFFYIASSGYVAIAINGGNAAHSLGIKYNTPITFVLSEHTPE